MLNLKNACHLVHFHTRHTMTDVFPFLFFPVNRVHLLCYIFYLYSFKAKNVASLHSHQLIERQNPYCFLVEFYYPHG